MAELSWSGLDWRVEADYQPEQIGGLEVEPIPEEIIVESISILIDGEAYPVLGLPVEPFIELLKGLMDDF